jgi:hypothetical protein
MAAKFKSVFLSFINQSSNETLGDHNTEALMSSVHRFLASLHGADRCPQRIAKPRTMTPANHEDNLRAEDGYVSVSRVKSHGFLRIFSILSLAALLSSAAFD